MKITNSRNLILLLCFVLMTINVCLQNDLQYLVYLNILKTFLSVCL